MTRDERAARGNRAVALHPDFASGGLDWMEAAADVIADILHAADLGEPQALLDRALRTYEGDAEDDEEIDTEPHFSSEAQETFTVGSRVFRKFETGNYVGSEPTIEGTYAGRVGNEAVVKLANGTHERWHFAATRNLYR